MSTSPNRDKAESILKMARIKEAPVDIDRVASSLEFKVVRYPFPDKLKGRVLIKDSVKVIGVNENHPTTLQRYTIAHELGHYLNGHEHHEKSFNNDDTRFYEPYFQQEKEADAFAAEILMPKFILEKDLTEMGLDIEKLIKKYQVSEQALWIRLTSLRLAEKYSKK